MTLQDIEMEWAFAFEDGYGSAAFFNLAARYPEHATDLLEFACLWIEEGPDDEEPSDDYEPDHEMIERCISRAFEKAGIPRPDAASQVSTRSPLTPLRP